MWPAASLVAPAALPKKLLRTSAATQTNGAGGWRFGKILKTFFFFFLKQKHFFLSFFLSATMNFHLESGEALKASRFTSKGTMTRQISNWPARGDAPR